MATTSNSTWNFTLPDFGDVSKVMAQSAKIVVDDIVHGIAARRSIDGGSQKANAISTVLQKKHDHPLIGGSSVSPLLAKASTYSIQQPTPEEAEIRIKSVRADVGVYVERKGYKFFGISKRAEKEIVRTWTDYVQRKIKRLFS